MNGENTNLQWSLGWVFPTWKKARKEKKENWIEKLEMVQLLEGQLALVNPGLNFNPGYLFSCSKAFG